MIGINMNTRVDINDVHLNIRQETYTVLPDGRTTVCQLTLLNGFTVTGESSCVDIANYNAADGNKYAREKAIDKVFMVLAYELKSKLNSK